MCERWFTKAQVMQSGITRCMSQDRRVVAGRMSIVVSGGGDRGGGNGEPNGLVSSSWVINADDSF